MTILLAVRDELSRGLVQCLVGAAIFVAQLISYFILRRTRPHVRFHKIKDYPNQRVTFLIRNLDPVRYRERLVLRLTPRSDIERVCVHGGPYCMAPPVEQDGAIVVAFDKVPADATFSIKVKLRPQGRAKIWLAESSPLRPRNFDDKLEAHQGFRRLSALLARGTAGALGFVAVLLIGLARAGEAPEWSDWAFIGAAVPLSLAVFVLVVPCGGKPILAGYLGWSGASKDWVAPVHGPPAPASGDAVALHLAAPGELRADPGPAITAVASGPAHG